MKEALALLAALREALPGVAPTLVASSCNDRLVVLLCVRAASPPTVQSYALDDGDMTRTGAEVSDTIVYWRERLAAQMAA